MSKSHQQRWNAHYEELVAFHQRNNHTRVSWKDSHPLYCWLNEQRHNFKKGTLSEEKLLKLNQLGDWVDNKIETDSNEVVTVARKRLDDIKIGNIEIKKIKLDGNVRMGCQ